MLFFNYIESLSGTDIKDTYSFYNSALQFPDKLGFGENGAFEFLGAILLSEYDPPLKRVIVPLCQRVCRSELSPLQFSDKMDEIIYALPYLPYEDWSAVYRYLKQTQMGWAKDEWFYQRSKVLSPLIQSIIYPTSYINNAPLENEIIKAVGVTFEGRQNLLKKLEKGELLTLKRDYANEFGSNAITLHNLRNEKLGYVPKEKSSYLAPFLDSGNTLFGEVVEILGGENSLYYGFRFKIMG